MALSDRVLAWAQHPTIGGDSGELLKVAKDAFLHLDSQVRRQLLPVFDEQDATPVDHTKSAAEKRQVLALAAQHFAELDEELQADLIPLLSSDYCIYLVELFQQPAQDFWGYQVREPDAVSTGAAA